MRIDELHKFSDGTLNDVRTALNDRLKGIRMEYLPQTIWRQSDKDKAGAMIQAIDKQLKTRRIMRSLEKFVGGRPFCPDGEETVTLEKESRSKLDKDTVKPYNYTYQNSLYETFKPPSKAYLDQLDRAKEVRKTMWRKTFVRTKPNIAKNLAFLPISKSISKSRQLYNEMTNNFNHFRTICQQAWSNHTYSAFPNPTAKTMEVLIKTLLMPLSDKTILDSHCFVHELKREMNDDLEYVNSLEKELDELESEKADFSNIYDLLLEECVSKDVTCSYLHSLSDLNANTELQCLYLHKVKECECLALKLSKTNWNLLTKKCTNHLFNVDSGCTKHMTGNLKLLYNSVEKFLGRVNTGQFKPRYSMSDGIVNYRCAFISTTKEWISDGTRDIHRTSSWKSHPGQVQQGPKLATDNEMCMFALTVSIVEPKYHQGRAMVILHGSNAMQDDTSSDRQTKVLGITMSSNHCMMIIKLKWLWKKQEDEDQTHKVFSYLSDGRETAFLNGPLKDDGLCCSTRRGNKTELQCLQRAAVRGIIDVCSSYVMRTPTSEIMASIQQIPLYCDSQSDLAISCNRTHLTRTKQSILALPEDRFKYLVSRIGINPMIQPEPEDLPKDNPKLEIAVLRVILFSIHNDEWKSFQCHHQTALRFYTLAGNPVKEILLKLNLPDHRILKDGGEGTCIKVKEFQRSFRHSDTERLSRSNEVLKLKNFKKDATLKLFKSTIKKGVHDHTQDKLRNKLKT
ncbi:hypothetical protein Tco_1522233 [Tanacetum coccineum]